MGFEKRVNREKHERYEEDNKNIRKANLATQARL
jgi:hypothetical protein